MQDPALSSGEGTNKMAENLIQLAVLAILVFWCVRILQPFILPVLWGVIIAVAIYPLYLKLANLLGGRRGLASVLLTGLLLALLLGPTIMLTTLLVENAATLAQRFSEGQLAIPLPPDNVKGWPLVGEFLSNLWTLAATNLGEALKLVEPQLKIAGSWLLQVAASGGFALITFIFAFLIAGYLLSHSSSGHSVAHALSIRLAGPRGADLVNLAEATIRSVARGVLGVAVIQSILAGLGFAAVGLPGAGIWALLCLILATVQIGVGPIVIPAVIYVFATGETVTAVLFAIWSVFLLVGDNILKPLLLGRGVDVPMAVIFLGAIGGLLMSGIVGLFVGAVVLALGYTLFKAWIAAPPAA